MANHLQSILANWYPARDQCAWVLVSLVAIEGSNYRKTGAMMLVNELGQYYGLISGGCLEKSLLMEVKKVLSYDRPHQIQIDSSETSDQPWARALGCGGKLSILLQPVSAAHDYQALDKLYYSLQAHTQALYAIAFHAGHNQLLSSAQAAALGAGATPYYWQAPEGDKLLLRLQPQTQLLVFGGGADAIPLVQMALVLGWQVTLVDNRSGYADPQAFAGAQILRLASDDPALAKPLASADAAVVMHHNIMLDAQALRALQHSSARYIGLLGPAQRKHKVLLAADISRDLRIHGPMGLELGGDLPETIALSTLAQCQQVLAAHRQQAVSTPVLQPA